jgi:hypothetical protein
MRARVTPESAPRSLRPLRFVATGWILLSASAAGCSPQDRVVGYMREPFGGADASDGGVGLGTFSALVAIDGLLDATDVLQDPSLSADERELYFASTKGGTLDIWMSTRPTTADAWGTASLVQELSSHTCDDQEPELTSRGRPESAAVRRTPRAEQVPWHRTPPCRGHPARSRRSATDRDPGR